MKRRADGRWVRKVTLSDGNSKYFYSTAKSERSAVADFNKQILAFETAISAKNSFPCVAERWADETFPRIENNTLKQYKPAYQECIAFFKSRMIQDISPHDVKNFLSHLEKQGYSKKTIKNKFSVLSLIMKFALIEQIIPSNPCQLISVKLPNIRKKRTAISAEDIERIKHSASLDFGFFPLFLLYTGLRRGEAFALTPNDIDYENKTVSVTKTVEWIGNFPNIKNSPKTAAGNRVVPLADFLMPELIKRNKNKYIFQNSDGEIMRNHQITRAWNKYVAESSVSATPHELRHTYATMLFDANIDIKTAQTWLGHTDIKTTLDIYTHLSELRRTDSVNKWRSFLSL